ncbi:hypothetical protein ACJIZ3_004332 [Penstemon smallii]|uniref:F-box associated domain-containing protein n=1 Tax=Penstemon smallii TaxID=265156 RepID=A0ABD3S1U2_9LAMI
MFNLDGNGSMIERWTMVLSTHAHIFLIFTFDKLSLAHKHKLWDCDILSFLKLSLKRRSKEFIISILDGVIHMEMKKESVWELIFWSWKDYKAWIEVLEMSDGQIKCMGVYFLELEGIKYMVWSAGNVNESNVFFFFFFFFFYGCKS